MPTPRPGLTKASPPAAARPAGTSKAAFLQKVQSLVQAGDVEQAVQQLLAVAQKASPPDRVELRVKAAQLLRRTGRERAIQVLQDTVAEIPTAGMAWMTLAALYEDQRERKKAADAAITATQQRLTPQQRVDVGRLLSKMGKDRESLDAVRAGYAESGDSPKLASYALRVALQTADWALAERLKAQLLAAHQRGATEEVGETPRTHLLWCDDEAINVRAIAEFARRQFAEQPPLVTQAWPTEGGRKLRVGYISYDFRSHATSLLHLGAMRHHDHERFEWYAYCTSYDDGSAMRREMLSRFDKVRSVSKLSDKAAAQRIAEDRIDVLVDLNGLTEGTRLGILAQRPAPVQISYLGYPGTAGGRFVDYFIADPYTVPEGREALFPEKVIRIPHTYQINDYLARYLPPRPRKRPEGLPEGVPILGMFNNVNKLNPTVWQTWMRILQQAPQAVFWVLELNPVAREHLVEATRQAGVDPARLVFAPKAKQDAHVARLQWCDLMLDPWPYGGHTTTGDALFAGVPVLALEGRNFASRVSGGLLHAAGLPQLVQPTLDAYVAKAVELINDPAKLGRMKQYLLRNRKRLAAFDAPARTRHLETAYMAAYGLSARGMPPTHLRIEDRKSPKATAASAGATS